MKLTINYDLINEITKAKTGIDFESLSTRMVTHLGLLAILAPAVFDREEILIGVAAEVLGITFVHGGRELILISINKEQAEFRLDTLASSLTKINIYTTAASIKKARLYKTQYRAIRGDKLTLQQKKYITLPTDGTLNAEEISLLQEHNIGSPEYVLSIGEPQKVYKKTSSRVFVR